MQKFVELHGDPNCTEWMHDLLQIIEEDMLVVLSVEGNQRKSSADLLKKMLMMDARCRTEESYCLRGYRDPRVWEQSVGTLAELNDEGKRHIDQTKHQLRVHRPDGRPLRHSRNAPEEFQAPEDNTLGMENLGLRP